MIIVFFFFCVFALALWIRWLYCRRWAVLAIADWCWIPVSFVHSSGINVTSTLISIWLHIYLDEDICNIETSWLGHVDTGNRIDFSSLNASLNLLFSKDMWFIETIVPHGKRMLISGGYSGVNLINNMGHTWLLLLPKCSGGGWGSVWLGSFAQLFTCTGIS